MVGKKGQAGRSQLFAVERYGVQDYVLGLYRSGKNYTEISKLLFDEKNIKIAPIGLSRWIKTVKLRINDETNIKATQQFELMAMDYKKEITGILKEVKEMKDEAKNNGELNFYDKMIGRLYQGLELLAKLMGDMKPDGNVNVNIIIGEINRRVQDRNREERNSFFSKADAIDISEEIAEDLK